MNLRPVLLPMLVLAVTACSHDTADDAAGNTVSAAVRTQPVRQGTLPDIVSAYGTAVASVDAATTLAIPAEGHVMRFDVVAGSLVVRGQLLLTFELSPSAVAAYRQARAALEAATVQREHVAQLLGRQLTTRDQLAQADKTLSDARSGLDALRAQQGSASTIALRAPFDGFVSRIAAMRGDFLPPGSPLLVLTRRNGIVVQAGVEFDPRHAVMAGDTATLMPLGSGRMVAGTVTQVSGVLDPQTHLLDVEIVPAGSLLGGMAYRADITVGQWHGWVLPREALVGDGAHWHVYQTAAGKAVEVSVQVLGESDTTSVVGGALDAQRPLVIVGNTQLQNGMAVRAAEPSK